MERENLLRGKFLASGPLSTMASKSSVLPAPEQPGQEIELDTLDYPIVSEETRRDEAVALHPVDRGYHAWLFVAASACLELLVWGFPFWCEYHLTVHL